MSWNIDDGGKVTIEIIAERRQWQLEQLEKNTELLAALIRDEAEKGEEILSLSRRAKVSRPTIYRWLGDRTSD